MGMCNWSKNSGQLDGGRFEQKQLVAGSSNGWEQQGCRYVCRVGQEQELRKEDNVSGSKGEREKRARVRLRGRGLV